MGLEDDEWRGEKLVPYFFRYFAQFCRYFIILWRKDKDCIVSLFRSEKTEITKWRKLATIVLHFALKFETRL